MYKDLCTYFYSYLLSVAIGSPTNHKLKILFLNCIYTEHVSQILCQPNHSDIYSHGVKEYSTVRHNSYSGIIYITLGIIIRGDMKYIGAVCRACANPGSFCLEVLAEDIFQSVVL